MLGLGTSSTSIDSANIYKELSELANASDLDIHFDFSLIDGSHGQELTSAKNYGVTGATNTINSNEGTPFIDRTTLSRPCVVFDGTDDVLDMTTSYTTSGKAMTFFMVFQRSDVSNDYMVASSDDGVEDYIRFTSSGEQIQTKMQENDSVSTVLNSTANSSIDFTFVANVPNVYVLKRIANGSIYHWMDNAMFVGQKTNAAAKAADNFSLGAIGGTTSGSAADFTGVIGEVGLYDVELSDANISILMKELCTKWGVNRRE